MIRHSAPLLLENEPDDMGQRGVYINTSSVAAYDGQVGQVFFFSIFFFKFLLLRVHIQHQKELFLL